MIVTIRVLSKRRTSFYNSVHYCQGNAGILDLYSTLCVCECMCVCVCVWCPISTLHYSICSYLLWHTNLIFKFLIRPLISSVCRSFHLPRCRHLERVMTAFVSSTTSCVLFEARFRAQSTGGNSKTEFRLWFKMKLKINRIKSDLFLQWSYLLIQIFVLFSLYFIEKKSQAV